MSEHKRPEPRPLQQYEDTSRFDTWALAAFLVFLVAIMGFTLAVIL